MKSTTVFIDSKLFVLPNRFIKIHWSARVKAAKFVVLVDVLPDRTSTFFLKKPQERITGYIESKYEIEDMFTTSDVCDIRNVDDKMRGQAS